MALRNALAAKKANGAKLGNPRNISLAGAAGRTAQTVAADEFATGLMPIVNAIRAIVTSQQSPCPHNQLGGAHCRDRKPDGRKRVPDHGEHRSRTGPGHCNGIIPPENRRSNA
jgi:hypothetical protein